MYSLPKAHALNPTRCTLLLEEELLIVGELDDERHIERLLQPLREQEGHLGVCLKVEVKV